VPKFVKQYAALGEQMKKAFETYRHEVETGAFPSQEQEY
jgi:3-methyl-2-oxobutanoate hydroxymethyltransferase